MTPSAKKKVEKETAHAVARFLQQQETTRLVLVWSCSELHHHTPRYDHRSQVPKATKISSTLSVRPLLPASLSFLVSAVLLAFWNRRSCMAHPVLAGASRCRQGTVWNTGCTWEETEKIKEVVKAINCSLQAVHCYPLSYLHLYKNKYIIPLYIYIYMHTFISNLYHIQNPWLFRDAHGVP